MCAGCEFVRETATSNPSLFSMIFGYISSAILLIGSFLSLFMKGFAHRMVQIPRRIGTYIKKVSTSKTPQ